MTATAAAADFQRALAEAHAGDHAEAARLFARVLVQAPVADAAANLGWCLRRLERHDEAEQAFRHALRLDPVHPAATLNFASLLIDREELDEAAQLVRRTIRAHPDDAALKVNLASALFRLGDFAGAQEQARAALALVPDQPQAHYTEASVELVLGRLFHGFAEYEWRLDCGEAALALDGGALGIPRWRGESLKGKTLLAVTEQGIGDTLNFIRYGALVRQAGGRMMVTSTRSLRRLLEAAPCVDALLCDGDPRPAADYHHPLLSLPHAFGTTLATVPADIPYLAVREEWKREWAERLGPRRRFRVGLVWAGSPTHRNDRNRSLALARLAPLLDGTDWDCVALQVGMAEADRVWLRQHYPHIPCPGDHVRDYADTAALLNQIDLLISVDTSVVHLAGGLGVPAWVMVPAVPDWRWMVGRADTPWYPTMRLFRQPTIGDWDAVLDTVMTELRRKLAPPPPLAEGLAAAFNRAAEAQQAGRPDEAERGYRAVLAAEPLHPSAVHNLAGVLEGRGVAPEAEALLRQALVRHSGHASLHRVLGLLVGRRGDHAEAERVWRAGLAVDPDDAGLLDGLGRCLIDRGRLDMALEHYRAAAVRRPDDALFVGRQGAVLSMLGQWAEAAPLLERTAAAAPGDANAWSNLGICRKNAADYDGALAAFTRACELAPDLDPAHWNMALLLLLLGRFAEGWEHYERRWGVPGFPSPVRRFDVPPWRGEPLAGRRILVHWEQGFGDTIQFARLLPALKARGATVVLECQPQLFELFAAGLPGADEVVRGGEPLPQFDTSVPLLGIPRLISCDLAAPSAEFALAPWLRPDPARVERWTKRLGPRRRPRIGLVWSGSTTHGNDRYRSLPLARLDALLADDRFDWVSLQVFVRPDDAAVLDRHPQVVRLGGEFADFADSAAAMAAMDVVISVDTASAHLAGALGVPVWVLLPQVPDFRWLLEREDVPWYPSMRLFRQRRHGDWQPVIEAVAAALAEAGAGAKIPGLAGSPGMTSFSRHPGQAQREPGSGGRTAENPPKGRNKKKRRR